VGVLGEQVREGEVRFVFDAVYEAVRLFLRVVGGGWLGRGCWIGLGRVGVG
jgi:hypothetical protein